MSIIYSYIDYLSIYTKSSFRIVSLKFNKPTKNVLSKKLRDENRISSSVILSDFLSAMNPPLVKKMTVYADKSNRANRIQQNLVEHCGNI